MDLYTEYIIGENKVLILVCLVLAAIRIYLEIIEFDFDKLPLTRALKKYYGPQKVQKIHQLGLRLSILQIILFAPQFLLMN
ncbi:MAG: hypothetical protein H6622_05640 [Halobacteriovoraceae bacterium]|nr:hypothetical protein [Halobacteriovoraceae bacterium]